MRKLKSITVFASASLEKSQMLHFMGGTSSDYKMISRESTTPTNGCTSDTTTTDSYDGQTRTMTEYEGCCTLAYA
jgi:hypothetical protein